MNATPFIFGGDTGLSYDEIQRMQAIAQGLREPQKISTAGEGIRSAAQSLAGGMIANKARKAEAAGRDDFTQQLTAALRGGYGDSSASGYSTMGGGGFTPKPAPEPVSGPISAGPGGTSEGLTPQAQEEWDRMMTPSEGGTPGNPFWDDPASQARLSTSARVKEPENWEQIQNGIFAGESGGDYDALFGFRNRQPGAPQVSKMTVGQVMEFTDPRGPYAQSVKNEIGRVATPVGAYQIVGTTLRGAVKDLGIDPNTPFDKETQDLLGKHILATQGTGAWEGYKGPRDGYTPAGGSFTGGDYQTAQASLPDLDPQTLRLIELSNSEWATPGQRAMLGAMIDRRQKRQEWEWQQANQGRWETIGNGPNGSLLQRNSRTGEIKSVGGTQTTVNNNMPGTRVETEYDKERGKSLAAYMDTVQEEGDAASGALTSLDIMEAATQDPGFYSGAGAETVLAARRAAIALGLSPEAAVESTEVFNAQAKQAALDVMGGSLGTGFSNADRDFVLDQVPNLQNTPAGNRMLIEVQRRLQTRKIEISNMALEWEAENGSLVGFQRFLRGWSAENPVFDEDFADMMSEATIGDDALEGVGKSRNVREMSDDELLKVLGAQ